MITLQAYIYPADSPPAGAMQLDVSRLDVGTLAASGPPARVWRDVGAGLAHVSIKRGCTTAGLVLRGDVGTLTATFRDGGDPRTFMGLQVGTKVRLIEASLGDIFTGRFAGARLVPSKDTDALEAVWTITDRVQRLTDETAGPFTSTWYSAWGRSQEIDAGCVIDAAPAGTLLDFVRQGATSAVMSKADHLDRTAAGAMGMWYVDRSDVLHYREPRIEPEPAATYSDTAAPSYHAAQIAWDTAQVFNRVTLTSYATDPAAPTRDLERTATAEDATSITTYGVRLFTADVTIRDAVDGADLAEVAQYYATRLATPRMRVDSITLRGSVPAAYHDIATPLDITHAADTFRALVTWLEADITPEVGRPAGEHWDLTYGLTERNT